MKTNKSNTVYVVRKKKVTKNVDGRYDEKEE